jgi:hypothetical protein
MLFNVSSMKPYFLPSGLHFRSRLVRVEMVGNYAANEVRKKLIVRCNLPRQAMDMFFYSARKRKNYKLLGQSEGIV